MPIETPIYSLDAFTEGDIYSATLDRRRFTIIDSQLAFLSDLITDGRINGWHLSVNDEPSLQLKVEAGFGLIDGFSTYTFGSQYFNAVDNQTSYVYMRRKSGVIGGFSGFSVMSSITVSDAIAPDVPTGLAGEASYVMNSLTWDENTEADFDHYIIYRSENNITFSQIASVEINLYVDTGLTQNTNYYYKISAVDLSGNESAASSSILSKTLQDLRQPMPVGSLQVFSLDSAIEAFWNFSSSINVSSYLVVAQGLNSEFIPDSPSISQTVPVTKNFAVLSGLLNGKVYKVSVYAINPNNVASQPVYQIVVPAHDKGPGEISDMAITYLPGENDDVNVVMKVCFDPSEDPYLPIADRYIITLIENATQTSQQIVVPKGQYCREIRIVQFANPNGGIEYRSLKTRTNYIVRVQGVDIEGNINNGVLSQTRTPIFRSPPPVTNISISKRSDNSLYASWANGTLQELDHNEVTVKIKNTLTMVETVYQQDLNVGASTTYVIPSEVVSVNRLYTIIVKSVDIYGNTSISNQALYTVEATQDTPPPSTPKNQTAFAGDKQVNVKWESLGKDAVSSYSIWRGEFTFVPRATDFSLVDTVPNTATSYVDFSVENNKRYMYFVTATDVLGQESSKPSDEEFSTFSIIYAMPQSNKTLSVPLNLEVSQSGFDAVLTWDISAGSFDGYEIYRSIGNKYSFVSIGNVEPGISTYTDQTALLKNGTPYYYMVRKFRNEADIFVTESGAQPQGSIPIAKITVSSGDITIDEDIAVELFNLEDPVRTETISQIVQHRHNIDENGVDKRINLLSDVVIPDSEWTTFDFKTYRTVEDIGGATAYVVTLSGDVNQDYFKDSSGILDNGSYQLLLKGIPPFLFDVNGSKGEVVFEVPLYSSQQGVVSPFRSKPSIQVKLIDVTEVQNTLPNDRIGNISASQITSGTVSKLQIPEINHDGRIQEALIPVNFAMESDDKFTYSFVDSSIKISDAITFYDIAEVENDILLAASSRGILLSSNYGTSWSVVSKTPTAATKIFYSDALEKYFVLTNQGVFVSSGDLSAWVAMTGLENVKAIRDITEDGDGNLYISTDLGVYLLENSEVNQLFAWEQTSLFGPRSTESYALFYESSLDRVLVSNEFGILYTNTNGAAWTFIDDFSEFKKIYSFVYDGGKLFALTNDGVWRRDGSTFIRICSLAGQIARSMVAYQSKLIICTDAGSFITSNDSDIYADSSVSLATTFTEVNVNGNIVPVTCLRVIDSKLFAGTDYRLFLRDGNKVWIQYEDQSLPSPSVFVDKKNRTLGYYYNSNSNNISFDEKQDVNANISCAVSYGTFEAVNGGWVYQNYASRVKIVVNNSVVADTANLTEIPIDSTQFSGFQFPTYDESNSYADGAAAYQKLAEEEISFLVSYLNGPAEGETRVSLPTGKTLADVISSTFNSIDKLLSQIFEEDRIVSVTDDQGNTEVFPIELPSVNVNIASGIKYNATDGVFSFSTPLLKYDAVYADIIGATVKNIGQLSHIEVEDAMELINSGLPSSLSQVQQVNIVKSGIFIEHVWPGQTDTVPYQAVYNVPYDTSWYDVLNSTVDWRTIVQSDTINPTLPYASSAVAIPSGEILVGGMGGIFIINPVSYNMEFIELETNTVVKQIYLKNEDIYAVTEGNIFKSTYYGRLWTKLDRAGLPKKLFSISMSRNTMVVGAEDGIYFKTGENNGWVKALPSASPVEIMYDPDLIFAMVGNTVYFTADGSNWINSGVAQTVQISALTRFKSIMFAASDLGLYKDDGSFYGGNAQISLVNTLGTLELSREISVNDVASDTSRLVCGLSDGRVLILNETGWIEVDDLPLKSIHKVLVIGEETWLFGYDLFIVITGGYGGDAVAKATTYPIRISTGVPL